MTKLALIGATGIDWWVDPKKKSFVLSFVPRGSEIGNFTPRYGTHSVESYVDEAYNAPFILEQVMRANKEGYDVIVIDCACDPILDAAREISKIPVVAPRNAALHLALTLGTKFGIVTVQGDSLKRCMESGVRREGLEAFCAGVRFLKMPVLDIAKHPLEAQKELLSMCKKLIEEDGANVIVLGTHGKAGMDAAWHGSVAHYSIIVVSSTGVRLPSMTTRPPSVTRHGTPIACSLLRSGGRSILVCTFGRVWSSTIIDTSPPR